MQQMICENLQRFHKSVLVIYRWAVEWSWFVYLQAHGADAARAHWSTIMSKSWLRMPFAIHTDEIVVNNLIFASSRPFNTTVALVDVRTTTNIQPSRDGSSRHAAYLKWNRTIRQKFYVHQSLSSRPLSSSFDVGSSTKEVVESGTEFSLLTMLRRIVNDDVA